MLSVLRASVLATAALVLIPQAKAEDSRTLRYGNVCILVRH